MSDRKPALGKGLSALIPDVDVLTTPRASLEIDIDLVDPSDCQPRGAMVDERLQELAQSIKAHGVIQPIIARRAENGRYQIIAGERRWRASQLAGLKRVPVVLKDVPDADKIRRLEMALVENLQRENLNPIEEAQAFERLIREFGLRQEDIAARVGRDRSSIANTLRLLRLPDEVRAEVASGRLSMGHARAIVSLAGDVEQRRVARDVVARNLSVRETEAIVKKATAGSAATAPGKATTTKDVHTRAAEEELRLKLGTKVEIRRRGKGGTVQIAFANEDELQRIYEYLTASRR